MGFLSNDPELEAFTNLLAAAAVNKRLLMRVLAHMEHKELETLHAEVAQLDEEFRATIASELKELIERHAAAPPPPEPVKKGALPQGREEERRGHSLPNEAAAAHDVATEVPLGKDEHP